MNIKIRNRGCLQKKRNASPKRCWYETMVIKRYKTSCLPRSLIQGSSFSCECDHKQSDIWWWGRWGSPTYRYVRKVCSRMETHAPTPLSSGRLWGEKTIFSMRMSGDELLQIGIKWRIKWILLQETFAVVFSLKLLHNSEDGHSEGGTPTQRIHFLWTCSTTTLCCSALVVIKNRPLPFWSKGPVASWSILRSALFAQGSQGRKVLPALQQLRAKGDSFLQGRRLFIDFRKAHKKEKHSAMRKLLLENIKLQMPRR